MTGGVQWPDRGEPTYVYHPPDGLMFHRERDCGFLPDDGEVKRVEESESDRRPCDLCGFQVPTL